MDFDMIFMTTVLSKRATESYTATLSDIYIYIYRMLGSKEICSHCAGRCAAGPRETNHLTGGCQAQP